MRNHLINSLGLATIIILFVLSNILATDLILEHYNHLSMGVIAFLTYGIAAVVTILYTLLIRNVCQLELPSLRPEIRLLNPRLIVLGFIMIIAVSIVLTPLQDLLPEHHLDSIDRYLNHGLWAMVVAVILAPVFEEYIFRGVIQNSLINRYGPIQGIIFGALIFGVMHVIPQQAVNAAGVGLVLGSIYYLTGSLNTVIAIHFINNGFVYLLYMTFSDPNVIEKSFLSDTTTHVFAYALSLIILILGGGYVISYSRGNRESFRKTILSKMAGNRSGGSKNEPS